nr:M48 family metalloprotease [Sphingomonas jejuensis]
MLLATLMFGARPALAQSILRDAETEAVLSEMSRPLIQAAGLDPRNVRVIVLNDPSINAFVATGQNVYLHSGLILSAANANEVQGVIAHELGHIEGGHVVRYSEGMQGAMGVTILSLILGAAAMAAGAGEAGAGIMAAGQQAAMGKFLAFSRTQETSADLAGARYLNAAGVSGRGSLAFFRRLQGQELRLAIPQDDSYGRTHPLSGERVTMLTEMYEAAPAWDRPTDPGLEARFQRVKAKLGGFVSEPRDTLRDHPETDLSVPGRYARAYAWHKSAYPDRAMAEVNGLLASAPHDPYFLELKGQILLESGKPAEALPALREANERSGNQPLIAALYGHAMIATEDPTHFAEAERILRAAVARDNANPFAWYQLGIIYDRQGDEARAALATAERYSLQSQPQLAYVSASAAMRGLPEGSRDWLRAQDIAMTEGQANERRR